MQFSIVALFATGALATVCPDGIFSSPQCCSDLVLGIVGLNCATPMAPVVDGQSFKKVCAAVGDEPLCCVSPIAGQDLLCEVAAGTN